MKKKKAVVLFGSPHKQGYTSKLLKYFLKFLSNFSVETINAYDLEIKACVGCWKCKDSGECIFRDMDRIRELLIECDLVIIAFPVYNASYPAPLKAILDRLQIFYFSRHKTDILKNKAAVILFSQGAKNIDYEPVLFAQINPIIKILNASVAGSLGLKGTDDPNLDIDKFYIKSKIKIENIINNLYNIS